MWAVLTAKAAISMYVSIEVIVVIREIEKLTRVMLKLKGCNPWTLN
jgi:hypothetical protein